MPSTDQTLVLSLEWTGNGVIYTLLISKTHYMKIYSFLYFSDCFIFAVKKSWWFAPIIPELRRLRWGGLLLSEASLVVIVKDIVLNRETKKIVESFYTVLYIISICNSMAIVCCNSQTSIDALSLTKLTFSIPY